MMQPPRFKEPPCTLVNFQCVTAGMAGHQVVNPQEVFPAGNRPGADSTVKPQAGECYQASNADPH